MAQQGILVVLSGPSGTGKGTICKELLRSCPDLCYSISVTTRQPRAGEVNGVNYWFTAREEFENMIKNDELLEWAEVYGNYYGTPRRFVTEKLACGEDVILEIDTQGAMQVKKRFAEGVFVFIVPPSMDELAKRIYGRGTDSPDSIKKRLNSASQELDCASNYDYIVVNDQVNDAVRKISKIIEVEKLRTKRCLNLIEKICPHCNSNY